MKLVQYMEKNLNTGDVMQSMALMDFIERVYDIKIDRFEDRSKMTENDMIINGWQRHSKEKLPIHALYIGLHSDFKMMKNIYKNTIIGCRDQFTINQVKKLPHLQYIFTGCSTCTIPLYTGARKGKAVYLHKDIETGIIPLDKQMSITKNLIDELKSKELVTTNRLHIALPCIALGTPVIILQRNFQPERYSIFENLPNGLFPGFDKIISYEPNGLRDYLEKTFIEGFDKIVFASPNFKSLLTK